MSKIVFLALIAVTCIAADPTHITISSQLPNRALDTYGRIWSYTIPQTGTYSDSVGLVVSPHTENYLRETILDLTQKGFAVSQQTTANNSSTFLATGSFNGRTFTSYQRIITFDQAIYHFTGATYANTWDPQQAPTKLLIDSVTIEKPEGIQAHAIRHQEPKIPIPQPGSVRTGVIATYYIPTTRGAFQMIVVRVLPIQDDYLTKATATLTANGFTVHKANREGGQVTFSAEGMVDGKPGSIYNRIITDKYVILHISGSNPSDPQKGGPSEILKWVDSFRCRHITEESVIP